MQCLGIDPSEMTPSRQGIRAYDNIKREVLEVITLPTAIGPLKSDIQFQVLDVSTSFNLLLERPWIHQVSAIPSTLHQKIKLILNGSLLVIHSDPLIRQPTDAASPLLEIQPNEEPPYLTGFHFEETYHIQADPNCAMLVPPIMDDYLNPQVAVMM